MYGNGRVRHDTEAWEIWVVDWCETGDASFWLTTAAFDIVATERERGKSQYLPMDACLAESLI